MAIPIGEVIAAEVLDGSDPVSHWALQCVALEPVSSGTQVEIAENWQIDDTGSGGATSITINAVISTGADHAACAFVWNKGSVAPTGVTWHGAAMTKIAEQAINTWTLTFWLLPTTDTGTFELKVTFAASVRGGMLAGGARNVHQTTPTAGISQDAALGQEPAIEVTVTSGSLDGGAVFSMLVATVADEHGPQNIDSSFESPLIGDQLIFATIGQVKTQFIGNRRDITTKAPDTTGPGPKPAPPDEPPGGGGPRSPGVKRF